MYDRNDTVFNPDTCLKDNVEKWYDMKENGRSFLDASGNISFYDGTNAYIMRQENDHYF